MSKVTVIGIAGGTGSGKTTLAKRISEAFSLEDVVILTHDYYYRAHDELSLEERKLLNYDEPNAYETNLLVEDLKKLKRGETIYHPVYDFSIHNRTSEKVEVKPAKVIILEGILILADPWLREQMDMKVFVDTDADLRILRRLSRDVKERGRDIDSVISQYTNTVKPMHEQYVEPSKRYADIIVPQGGKNLVALTMICDKINVLLKENQ